MPIGAYKRVPAVGDPVDLEKSVLGVIKVTLHEEIRSQAEAIGEALIRLTAKGITAFGKDEHQVHLQLAGPGLLAMALDLAAENYTAPEGKLCVHTEAIRFFELGMGKVLDQIQAEGLAGLL